MCEDIKISDVGFIFFFVFNSRRHMVISNVDVINTVHMLLGIQIKWDFLPSSSDIRLYYITLAGFCIRLWKQWNSFPLHSHSILCFSKFSLAAHGHVLGNFIHSHIYNHHLNVHLFHAVPSRIFFLPSMLSGSNTVVNGPRHNLIQLGINYLPH